MLNDRQDISTIFDSKQNVQCYRTNGKSSQETENNALTAVIYVMKPNMFRLQQKEWINQEKEEGLRPCTRARRPRPGFATKPAALIRETSSPGTAAARQSQAQTALRHRAACHSQRPVSGAPRGAGPSLPARYQRRPESRGHARSPPPVPRPSTAREPSPSFSSLSFGLSKEATPLEITPPFRTELTHGGTKINKSAHFHNSRRKPRPVTGLETRQSIPTWSRSRLTPRWLAASSAVTAESDARAGFQTGPTWRGLAVRMRDALARRG